MTTVGNEAAVLSPVDRRLQRLPIPVNVTVPLVGSLILFASDTQLLSVTPLVTSIEKQWGLTPTQLSWGLSVLGIVGAAAVPTLSRLGDMIGMRRLLIFSVAVATVGTFLTALAHGFALFVAGRALMGLSAALPFVYALTREKSTKTQHVNRGVGIYAVATAVGIALSYFLSGIVVKNHGSVNTVFWVMTGISLVALLLAYLYMPDNGVRARVPLDLTAAVLLVAGLACLVLGLNQGPTWGWSSVSVLTLVVVGAVLLLALVGYENRKRHPMLDMRVLSRREVWPALLSGGVTGLLAVIISLTFSTYSETPKVVGYGFGLSVWQTSLWFEPYALAIFLSAMSLPYGLRRFGVKPCLAAAGAITVAAFVIAAACGRSFWSYELGLCLYGVGGPWVNGAAVAAFLQASRRGETGLVNAGNVVVQDGFTGIAPAIFTAILLSSYIGKTAIPAGNDYNLLWWSCAGFALLYLVLAWVLRKPSLSQETPEEVEVLTTA